MLMPGAAGLGAVGGVGAVGAPAEELVAAGLGALAASTPMQKDTTWTKLFVGGLPYHTTDKSLRDHFSVYGDIDEAVVITDRQTGKSRGYGFVIMGDKPSADRAAKDANPIIDGRKANVNLAILGAKPRGTMQAAYPFPAGIRGGYPQVLPSQYGIPPAYMYQTPYLTTTSPGGLVQLQASQLNQAAAAAMATAQFYEYHNAAAAASYQPSYNFAEAYPYANAAAAGMCLKSVQNKDNSNGLIQHHHHQQHNESSSSPAMYQRFEKALLPPFLPSVLHSNANAAAAANYVAAAPYSYASLPGAAGLPAAAAAAATAAGAFPGLQYQANPQEARLQ